jgi:hypothetical protein
MCRLEYILVSAFGKVFMPSLRIAECGFGKRKARSTTLLLIVYSLSCLVEGRIPTGRDIGPDARHFPEDGRVTSV